MSLYFYRWTKLAIVSGLVGILMGCANDPGKVLATGAVNYGCTGLSVNDCMAFHTPVSAAKSSKP